MTQKVKVNKVLYSENQFGSALESLGAAIREPELSYLHNKIAEVIRNHVKPS